MLYIPILSILAVSHASRFSDPLKDQLFTDYLLRDIIDRMGSELAADSDDVFMDYRGLHVPNEYDNVKEIPVQLNYEALENVNPNPSIRDQEYLRHSSLQSYQRVNNDKTHHEIQQSGIKGMKNKETGNDLPAYCTPPNPCPVGYTSADNCLEDFENSATFSRDFQNAQDCMCDKEHMFHCPDDSEPENTENVSNDGYANLVPHFEEKNPYLSGEKLPIAAKKGINVMY